jgi:hypothetical protein
MTAEADDTLETFPSGIDGLDAITRAEEGGR